MRKLIFLTAAAGAMLIAGSAFAATAQAATLDQVVATAREYGYSDDEIQTALNKYEQDMKADPYAYDEYDMDTIIQQIKANGKRVVDTVPYNPDVTIPGLVTTAAPDTTTTAADSPAETTAAAGSDSPAATSASANIQGGTNNGGGQANNGGGNNSDPAQGEASDDITLTMPDGSTFTRISAARFIALSYEDKLLYLGTFTPEQQAVFIENMTPEERRCMMKQLPTDKKAEVVDGMKDIAGNFGLNLSVDEMTDDSLVINMKDENGTLVSVTRAGDVVDDTGYDRRGLLALSAGLVMLGITGIIAVFRKYFGRCANE